MIADALLKKEFTGRMMPIDTNIIIYEVIGKTAASIVSRFKENDIKVMAISPTQIRMVLHLDITENMVQETIEFIDLV